MFLFERKHLAVMLLYWHVAIDKNCENTKQVEANEHAVVGEK